MPFFRSRPSLALALGTAGSVAAGVLIPFTPVGRLFGFSTPPAPLLLILASMVVVYMALVEAGKVFFFGRLPPRPHQPVSGWELAPALRNVERFASRWSSGRPRRRRGPDRGAVEN